MSILFIKDKRLPVRLQYLKHDFTHLNKMKEVSETFNHNIYINKQNNNNNEFITIMKS